MNDQYYVGEVRKLLDRVSAQYGSYAPLVMFRFMMYKFEPRAVLLYSLVEYQIQHWDQCAVVTGADGVARRGATVEPFRIFDFYDRVTTEHVEKLRRRKFVKSYRVCDVDGVSKKLVFLNWEFIFEALKKEADSYLGFAHYVEGELSAG
jgi:hypothetical protein